MVFFIQSEKINSEAYLGPCQTSVIKFFAHIIYRYKPLTFYAKSSILNIWQGPKYAHETNVQKKIQQGIIHLVRTQNFPRTCAYQGVINVSFSENFADALNEWSLIRMLEAGNDNEKWQPSTQKKEIKQIDHNDHRINVWEEIECT